MTAQRIGSIGMALLAAATLAQVGNSAPASLVIGNDAPAWSPDATRVAFTAFRHGRGEIYAMNADGGAQTRLTSDPAHDDHPAWSPDGSRIAWRTNRDGNPEIYSMHVDGTDVRRLTFDTASDEAPDWSRDGRIAFSSNRVDEGTNIYVMNADGSDVRQVTSGRTSETEPSWSPDGSRLLYVADRDVPIGNTEIYVTNVDGSGDTRLTSYRGRDDWPDWSPRGDRILFARGVTWRSPEVFVSSADGSRPAPLTKTAPRLEVTFASAQSPRAGTLWSITVAVHDVRGVPLRRAVEICRATIEDEMLKPASSTLANGIVRCSWRVPATAKGKLLRGTAGARLGSLRASIPFAMRVL
jgi:Tol biopolymer transport system component